MDKKPTDAEIVNGLECFKNRIEKYCEHCDTKFCNVCIFDKIKLSPDLINRQKAKIKELSNNFNTQGNVCENLLEENANLKAEIERLKLELADTKRDLKIVCDNSISVKLPHCVLCGKGAILTKSLADYDELIADISAESYKEFAERLNSLIMWSPKKHISITVKDINNLLKEMVGDK